MPHTSPPTWLVRYCGGKSARCLASHEPADLTGATAVPASVVLLPWQAPRLPRTRKVSDMVLLRRQVGSVPCTREPADLAGALLRRQVSPLPCAEEAASVVLLPWQAPRVSDMALLRRHHEPADLAGATAAASQLASLHARATDLARATAADLVGATAVASASIASHSRSHRHGATAAASQLASLHARARRPGWCYCRRGKRLDCLALTKSPPWCYFDGK